MTRKTLISTVICVLLITSAAVAQGLPTAKPESAGLSSERLQRIGTVIQRNIDEKRIAGAVTLVARRGSVVWFKAQGMADAEAGKPMRPDTLFRICSVTKPITSVAVMMLYEEGRFLLDDPVSKYRANSVCCVERPNLPFHTMAIPCWFMRQSVRPLTLPDAREPTPNSASPWRRLSDGP